MKLLSIVFSSADVGLVFNEMKVFLLTEGLYLSSLEELASESNMLVDAGRIPRELSLSLSFTKIIDHIASSNANCDIDFMKIECFSFDDIRQALIQMFSGNNDNFLVIGGSDIGYWESEIIAYAHDSVVNDVRVPLLLDGVLSHNIDYIEKKTDSVQLWHLGEDSPFYRYGCKSQYIMTGNEALLDHIYKHLIDFRAEDQKEIFYDTYNDFSVEMKTIDFRYRFVFNPDRNDFEWATVGAK